MYRSRFWACGPWLFIALAAGCSEDSGGPGGSDVSADTAAAASDATADASLDSDAAEDSTADADPCPGVACEPNQRLGSDCVCVDLFVACTEDEVQAPATGASWPSFGHDHRGSRTPDAETAIGADTVPSLEVAWAWTGPEVTATPVVTEGIAYIADWSGMLRARGAETGCIVWETRVSEGALTATPLVHEGVIYIADSDGVLYALEQTDGQELWHTELDPHPSTHIFSSAEILGDTLVIGVAGIELTENIDDFTFRGSVVGLDRDDGDELWRVYTTENDETAGAGVSVWSSAAIDDALGVAYIGTGNTYEAPASPLADGILAIDVATGEVLWHRQFTADDVYAVFASPPLGPDADVGAAPNLFDAGDVEAVGVGDKAGVYSALDRRTGDTLWATQLTDGSHLGGVMTAAAVAGDRIFVSSNLWPDGFDTENPFLPDFQDPDNTSEVFALDAETGDILWRTELPRVSLGALSSAGGAVFVGTHEGTLTALDAETGTVLWTDKPGHTMASGQSIVDGHLFVPHGFEFFGLDPGPENAPGGLTVYRAP